jgi:hypothetical protein
MLVTALEDYDEFTGKAVKAPAMLRGVVGKNPPLISVASGRPLPRESDGSADWTPEKRRRVERRGRPQCRGVGGRHRRMRHAARQGARVLVSAKEDLAKDRSKRLTAKIAGPAGTVTAGGGFGLPDVGRIAAQRDHILPLPHQVTFGNVQLLVDVEVGILRVI